MRVPTIFTIGYEQATQAAVVSALREAGVEVLADIRYLPLSRRPGFSKSSLRAAVEEAGIGYRHFKQLGTPADGRAAARRGDHAELRALAEAKRVALLCYERDAAECHRSLLFDELFADFARVDLVPNLVVPAQAGTL